MPPSDCGLGADSGSHMESRLGVGKMRDRMTTYGAVAMAQVGPV